MAISHANAQHWKGDRVNRRTILLSLMLLPAVAAKVALGQQPKRVPTIGMIRGSAFDPNDPSIPPFLQALRELGYQDGQNIKVESRYAEGHRERLPRIAADFVDDKVDVITAANEPALRAAKRATTTTPIVFLAWDYDPQAAGLIDSLSRPGGNATGVVLLQTELMGKRLELLKEALPGTRRVMVFWDSFSRKQLEQLEPAARSLNIQLRPIEVRDLSNLTSSFRAGRQKGDAGMFLYSPAFFLPRARIAESVREAGLPTVFQEPWFATSGGLLSYGPDYGEAVRRVAYLIDRLLKGAKPSDLPVEQISKFHLAVNLKTARTLGVNIPQSILMRADEVIR